MCELDVTVELYRATNNLSDADSHFFPKQKTLCSRSLSYICTSAQESTDKNIRLLKEKMKWEI